MALVAVGVVVSYVALRKLPNSALDQPGQQAQPPETVLEQVEEAAAAELGPLSTSRSAAAGPGSRHPAPRHRHH